MNFVDSVCDIIFLSHAKAQRAQRFYYQRDYTDFPRDPRDPWRHLNAPHGNCLIMLIISPRITRICANLLGEKILVIPVIRGDKKTLRMATV